MYGGIAEELGAFLGLVSLYFMIFIIIMNASPIPLWREHFDVVLGLCVRILGGTSPPFKHGGAKALS